MNAFESRILATGHRMVNKFGKTVTYITVTPGVYDPATARTIIGKVNKSIKAVLEDATASDIAAGRAIASDLIAMISPLDIAAPKSADRITIAGVEHAVVSVRTEYAGEEVAMFYVTARAT